MESEDNFYSQVSLSNVFEVFPVVSPAVLHVLGWLAQEPLAAPTSASTVEGLGTH